MYDVLNIQQKKRDLIKTLTSSGTNTMIWQIFKKGSWQILGFHKFLLNLSGRGNLESRADTNALLRFNSTQKSSREHMFVVGKQPGHSLEDS